MIELSKWNEKVYRDVKLVLSSGGKCAIVQPTGTGKSYILMRLLLDYSGYKIVIGSSRQVLEELTSKDEWCGDSTICCTYNNLDILKEYIINNNIQDKISLIALDELHRAGADTWYPKVKELMSMAINSHIIGLTATPVRYLDKKRDMVQELFNGVSVSNLTLKEAIKNNMLPSPKYITAMFSIDKDIKDRLKLIESRDKNKKAEYARECINRYLCNWDRDKEIIPILKENIGMYYDKNYKHIVFVPSIAIANEIEETVRRWFNTIYAGVADVNVYKAHSKNKESRDALREFCKIKEGNIIDVLISINMANEGLHVENTKSIMLLRNTQSPILYLQQIGRALSYGGCEPIIFDFVGSIKAIGNILDLLEVFDIKANNNRAYDIISTASKGILKEYTDTTKEFRNMMVDIDSMFSDTWQSNYNSLYKEVTENNLTSLNDINNKQLLKWAKHQQRQLIGNRLEQDKVDSLNELGVIVYNTDSLSVEDKDILYTLYNKDFTILDKLKYRLYCNKLPIEIALYLHNNNIELTVTSNEMLEYSMGLNKELSIRVRDVIDTVLTDDSISIISENFNIHKYINTINGVLEVTTILKDSTDDIPINILRVYWNNNRFKLGSRIELNEDILLKHIEICKEYLNKGVVDTDKYINKKDSRYKLSYTYKLIEKINKLA